VSHAAALVAQILEAPEDDAARLVLADWLEEQGSPRAELIRRQVSGAAVSAELAARCASELAPLAAWVREPVFERGLVRVLQLLAGTYVVASTQKLLLAHLPRVGVELTMLRGQSKKLGGCAALACTARLHWWNCQLADDTMTAFVASPHLERLSALTLEKVRCGNAGLVALARSRALPRLHRLALPAPVHLGTFTTDGIRAVLDSSHVTIEHLLLGAASRVKLADLAPSATRLRSLEVWTTRLGDFASTPWPQLTRLAIHSYNAATDDELAALLDNPGLSALQSFTLAASTRTSLSAPVLRRLRDRFGAGFIQRTFAG